MVFTNIFLLLFKTIFLYYRTCVEDGAAKDKSIAGLALQKIDIVQFNII